MPAPDWLPLADENARKAKAERVRTLKDAVVKAAEEWESAASYKRLAAGDRLLIAVRRWKAAK